MWKRGVATKTPKHKIARKDLVGFGDFVLSWQKNKMPLIYWLFQTKLKKKVVTKTKKTPNGKGYCWQNAIHELYQIQFKFNVNSILTQCKFKYN